MRYKDPATGEAPVTPDPNLGKGTLDEDRPHDRRPRRRGQTFSTFTSLPSSTPAAEIRAVLKSATKVGDVNESPASAGTNRTPNETILQVATTGDEPNEISIGTGLNLSRGAPDTALKLDFPEYALAIARVLRDARGEFCMALLGRWGAGKTRLARLVEQYITDPKSFNAERTLSVCS